MVNARSLQSQGPDGANVSPLNTRQVAFEIASGITAGVGIVINAACRLRGAMLNLWTNFTRDL
jgi:hypothetical protein